jgi:hypothetical protein
MTDDYQLTERAKAWVRGFRAQFVMPYEPHEPPAAFATAQ